MVLVEWYGLEGVVVNGRRLYRRGWKFGKFVEDLRRVGGKTRGRSMMCIMLREETTVRGRWTSKVKPLMFELSVQARLAFGG